MVDELAVTCFSWSILASPWQEEAEILQEKHVTANSPTINPIWTVQGYNEGLNGKMLWVTILEVVQNTKRYNFSTYVPYSYSSLINAM